MADSDRPSGEAGTPSPELLEALLTCVEIASLGGKINKALLRLGFEQELIKAGRGVPDARVGQSVAALQSQVATGSGLSCADAQWLLDQLAVPDARVETGPLSCGFLPHVVQGDRCPMGPLQLHSWDRARVCMHCGGSQPAAVPDAPLEPKIDGRTSDGYHTFDELYAYRKAFNALLFNEWGVRGLYDVHKAWRHSDGELCFGGGWFVVVAQTPCGQISNHYSDDWDLFDIPERERANEWDGHTPEVALTRMLNLAQLGGTAAVPAALRAPREHAEGCINCGITDQGGYETEEVGSFCKECWELLREHFERVAADAASRRPRMHEKEEKNDEDPSVSRLPEP